MICAAESAPSPAARCQASFMPAALTHTAAPDPLAGGGNLGVAQFVQSIATTISRRAPTTSGTHDLNKSQENTPALLSSRSTCLIADLAIEPPAVAKACPIRDRARAAPVITPSVPLVRDKTRLACKSPPNTRFKNSSTTSNRPSAHASLLLPADSPSRRSGEPEIPAF